MFESWFSPRRTHEGFKKPVDAVHGEVNHPMVQATTTPYTFSDFLNDSPFNIYTGIFWGVILIQGGGITFYNILVLFGFDKLLMKDMQSIINWVTAPTAASEQSTALFNELSTGGA